MRNILETNAVYFKAPLDLVVSGLHATVFGGRGAGAHCHAFGLRLKVWAPGACADVADPQPSL